MHIRPYAPADISAATDIMASNNETDALSRYFTRDTFKYYTTYRLGALRYLKDDLAQRGRLAFVLETDPSDYDNADAPTTAPEIVGLASWNRIGNSAKAKEWQRANSDLYTALNRGLMLLGKKYRQVFTGVEHTFNYTNFQTLLPLLTEGWDKEIFAEAWELKGLCIHRDWQKRGLSKMLINWGKERAREEKVPLVVDASPVGNLAYRSAGFKSIGFLDFDKYFDVLEFGGERMQKWVWEPELEEGSGVEGDWITRATAKRIEVMKENEAKQSKKQ